MTKEFIIIIALVAVSLVVNIITLVVVIMSNKSKAISNGQNASIQAAASKITQAGVVFCRSCGNQYDSSIKACPNCKTPR